MAGKAHGNGDRRGDNTICGLGDRLRRLTAGICLITQTIFPVMAAAPTHINPAHSDTAASLILPNVKTIPYTLGALESPPTVAARFGITVDELRRLNQFRTFARGFDNVRQGDEIDVPLINSNSPEARNLKAMQMERDGKDPQMQVAEVAQQSGTLLARDMDSEQAASMARGWVASSASAQATDWLSRWGTARVSLGVDEDFSLKSSSFEFLHPWYETPDNLVFSQHTLHRTDDRTQTNHGIGWRYFTPSWMSGVNMFIDHDLTRYHTRTGMGVEYWRDYLKLSGNGYLRLSNWRSAPELDNDYEARPANGWDLRAEGWLPAWPQLGGKLVYEQYYGDEVALFGKDERQNDPHAITAGLSYTPVPLISFSAEQRQGKQGENDTRIGMELTLQPGHSLQKQLDPAEVAARRSLVGSRYDLVDRNNNIVLEYRKKELVRLTLTDPLKGKPGEVKSLVSSLQTKYALKGYDIEAASLQSAGGKVAVSGKDIQVTIPPYRFTAMPETDNTYPIAVTAEDSKGNFSRREESMVVVEKPTLSLADSTLSVDLQILLADGKSTSTLTYTARDSSGKPIPGMTLKTQAKGLQDFALSEWKDNGNGTYTQIVTAGKTSGALSLMPQFNGDDIAKTPALIAIVANTASRADSTIETDQDNYVAGKPIVVKVTLRDDNGNGVTGRKELLKQAVKVDNTKADAVSAWTEESEGIYKASYTAHLIGDKLTAQLTMPGWQTKHSDAFSIVGDKDTAKIAAMQITANNAVARRDHNTVAVTVRDVHQNLLQGQNVTFTVVNGAAVFADPNGGIVTTDKDGIASVNLASDQAVNSLIKAETNGSSQSVEVSFITGDISQLTSTIKTDDVSYTAGGKIKVSVTLMDEQKNLVKGMASLLAGSGVVEVSGTDKNETGNWSEESDGVYTTTRTAKIAGDRHYATLKLSTWSSAQQSDAYAIRESGAVLAYSSIVTDKTAYTAGGAIKVTVTLKDSYENLVGGQRDAINQAIQLPNTKAESIAWNEDQKGIYTATYTALLPGTGLKAQLQMSGWASALSSNDYSISGDAASAQIVAMQVTTGNPDVLANGSDRHTVNVRVEDQFGNVLPEQTVTFTVTKGAAVFANAGQSADIRTDAHGMAEVDLSSTVADASTVEAKINQSSDSKTVNFVADVSTAQVAELVVIKDGSEADGSTANTLRVKVTDAFGNALAGQTVSVLAGNGATVAPTVITEPDGTVEISVTSQTAGTSVVTVSVNNSSQSQNVTFIADIRTAQIADLVVTRDNSVADGSTANTLQVRVTDAFGNALNGQTVSVLADNGATVTPTVTTEPDGTVEISITSQTAGVSAVTATINSSTQSQNVTFIADVRTAKIADLVVIKDDSVADGAMANTLRARVTDAFGNTLGGQTVSVLADNGATVAPTVTTQPDGTVEISVTSQTAGTSTVTASINNSSLSQNVTFVADVRTAKIASLEVTRDNSVADGAMANTLRVKVTDAFGNALNGQTVSVMADNGATVAPTVITEPDGTVEISVTSQTAGVSAVTATINSSSQSQNVTFIADVSTAKIADLVVIKDGSEADGSTANTLRARVTDAFGNTLGGQTVSVLADNGATVAPTVTTQPDGTVEISVTSQTAGTSTVTASINNSSLSQNVTFVADVSTAKIADLVVIKDGSEADGSTANTLQVKVTDAFGNALAGQTVSVMAGNGATVAPTVITEPDGTVEISVTSQTAGTSTVTASINNSSQSRDVTFIADVRTAQIASLEVTQDNAVADGAMANTLRARVTDAFGNALAGQTVSVMAGNGATTAPTVTTQPDGTVEISVTSQTAGISTVTATINNSTLSQNVTFIADVRTAKIADLVVIKDGSEADGSTANTLRVKVTDAFGNTLAGQTVSVLGGNGATTAPTVITGPDGTVESSVTSQTAGISTVTATINNSSLSRNVTFIADVRTAQIASLEVTQDNAVADGAMANTLRVKVTDAFGNVLAGQMVSVTAGNSATVASTVTTHPDGTVEISVTSQTAGTSTVTASINSSSQSQSVKFIADVSTAQIAVLEVTQDNSVADGSTANTLLVRVTDAFGNTLAGQTVSVTAGNGATVAPTVITEPDGTVEISVTSQTAGISAVTASINSSSQSRNVTFIADVRTAQIADLAVIKDGSVADGSTANTLRARVTDAFGNALAGQTVSVLADNGATVSPTVITGPDGTVEISVTSQTAGISAVTVSINNSTLSQNVTFIADVRTAKIAELVVSQDNAVADGATANTLRVRVTDAFGNALAGQTVSVLAGNGATTAPTVTTQPDGTVEISVTSQMAGTSAVTASINSSSQSGDVTFIADASTAQIADLVVIKDGSEADGSTANTLRARVTDAFGNALAGQTVSVTADNGATLSPTVITGPDGTVEISVTSQTAGASTVTASINSSSQSRNVTFIADVRTAQIASLEVRQDNSVADGAMANTLRVKVTDAFGNALAGQTVSVMAGNGATVAPTVITEPDGTVEISVTSQTAGISTVTATINSSSQSRDVAFIADASTAQIADLVVIKDGSEADGSTANTLRVRVTDAFGNALNGQTVSVTAGNSATVAPTVTTGPDGTVEISVTSQTAGISAVTASINSSSLSRDVTFIADASTAQIADLVVIKDGSEADGATANTLRARVTDAFGNALAGQTVSVTADNSATLSPTVITGPDGTVEISVTSQTAGASTVTASINSSSQSRNVTFIADVRTAQIASLEVRQDNSVADGAMANTLRVKVTDAFGNALAGQTVSVMAGNGATVAPTVITEPDGTVEISVTSQTAGIITVTASINNSSQSRDVTFIADVRTAKIADLVVSQDNAVADGAMANTLQVRVTDAFGNTLAGQTVSVTAGNGATVAPAVTTEPDGTVEIPVTSQTAGTSAVTASINTSSQSQNVTFIADVRTAKIADLVVTRDNSVADGSTANTLRVRVTDTFGNTLAGQTVSVLADNGATVAPTVITGPDGTAEIFVTSQTAGISAVTASINSSTLSRDVTFIADVRTAQIADLVVIKDDSVADGAMANMLRARVTDAFGNALAGQTVSVTAGNGATTAPTVTTQPDGTVEISVTSQTAGISTVTATINSSTLSRDVTFIADVRTAQIASLEVTQDNSVADGAMANTLRVKVTDAFGNALAGQTVSVTAGNGATTAPTVTTQPDGTVEISVTSQTAGISTVTATINSSTLSRDVTFIADVRTAQIASLEMTQDNSVADGAMANTLRVKVTDAFGNALAGQTVSVSAGNGATVTPTVTTQPDGTVEISVTSQTAGISTVTATINSSSQSRDVTFIADASTVQIADLVVIKDGSEADGSTANTLRARVTDAFGNALAGQTVSVLADNGATVSPTVITGPDGTVEISVTSQTAGISTVTATINSSSQSRDVTFIADVRTAQIADLVVIKDGSEADGSTANTLRARVTDAFGNTLAGQTVSVLGGNGATTAPTVITGPDGTVEISVTSQTAGISVVTASINSSSQSRDVTFIADVRTAQIADLVVIKDGSVADGATANTLQVKVTDANGNALAGQTVSVMAGNGATTAPTVTTQPDGTVEISVTSQTAGTSVVTASINNSSQSQNVTFVPGDASQLTSTVETNKSNYTVGETITITVTLRDAFDNLVTGAASQLAANGVLTVAGTDPSETGSWVESGGVYTTTRMATIASTNQHANLQLQSWSDGVTSDRYDIQSGSPAQATSTIATDKNAYTAGETITVAVTLKDAHGNLVEGGESLLSGDNVIVEGAVRSGGWSENAGVYTATWSAQMAGDSHHATLKLSEWGSSKQSESYSIHSGAPVQANSAIRTDKSAYIAGEPLTVTVTLRDEFGNPAFGLTSEVIESYIDSFAVGGATPDSMQWVEQNNGEYTIVWTAWVAEENLVASLKLKTWAAEIKSSLYGIQPGAAAKTQSTIVADKTIYIAGDSITVTVVLKDAQGNFITDGVVQLNEENVQVRNADPIQGNNWVYNGNGQYQRQYMAHFAEANLNAQLKMAGWSDANYSNNYTIKPGEVSPLGSQLRIREVLVVEGADLPVSALLVDDFGNPVDNGLDLLDDAVYLQNVEKKEGEKWRYVGDGIYERTYMAYQEGENLTSFMEIKGWRIYGQPSYTILPFVEVESLSVNGVKFRATDGFPETGFDGAKFTLLLTHNMKNTDYNWTAGIYGINVDSNGEVTLSVLIRSEVTITGKPKNGKGNDVVFKFKIKKWFTSLGASSSNTWDIINTSCSYGQMPSSLELAQRPSGGVVPRKVGTLWGEYGNLKTYGNAFSSTDYWTSTQLMGVHEKFNPETGISELGTGKSSGLCVEYY
ncbi:inverse autotransporter adhesin IatC [Escherichia coli]|nr:inverse autotransporter adhesin IatC [Escherichia coli]MDF9000062.1 inverse autotransporter adhesin IatC [Escherichia coli]MDG5602863.1 Ig-like domain-containing protein [Escherichia coli]MDG5614324.1 Ig-like domain-containing protein [Escherichia coli]QYE20934.1 Ig-like domain-containing protein [Escherichia coli]